MNTEAEFYLSNLPWSLVNFFRDRYSKSGSCWHYTSINICIFTWQEIDGQLRLIGYNPALDETTHGNIQVYRMYRSRTL
jgi:hypothetical protein